MEDSDEVVVGWVDKVVDLDRCRVAHLVAMWIPIESSLIEVCRYNGITLALVVG